MAQTGQSLRLEDSKVQGMTSGAAKAIFFPLKPTENWVGGLLVVSLSRLLRI
jgi:hypothetical protein